MQRSDDDPKSSGPVTLGSHEFFAQAGEVPQAVTMAPTPRKEVVPPRVPEPTERVRIRETGPIVVPTTTPAWLVSAAVFFLGVAVATILFLDLRERTAALAAAEAAIEKVRAELVSARADVAQKEQLIKLLENDRATLAAQKKAQDEELAKLKETQEQLAARVSTELITGDVTLKNENGNVTVDPVDKLLFESGKAEVSPRGQEILGRLATVLAKVEDRNIAVIGHTDDAPPLGKVKEEFPTNWELSVARATNVVRFLQEQGKVPGKRLVATGRGQHQPVSTNANAKGRQRNRRIEILLTPIVATPSR